MRLAKNFKYWKMARTIKELGHPCSIPFYEVLEHVPHKIEEESSYLCKYL